MNFEDLFKKVGKGVLPGLLHKLHRVLIADTTLRDGEQAPGASLSVNQKVCIAHQLDELGVDSIETGFPVSSKEDFQAAQRIAAEVKRPVLTALSRCLKNDIDAVCESLKHAKRWSISLFVGVSPLLRKYSVGKSKEEILEIIKDSIQYARRFTDSVAFGAEDATRTEPEFLYKVYEIAIKSGAFVLGVPDTVGCLVPGEVTDLIERIKNNVVNINKVLLAVHFHNDLGLAVANSLAAIESGVHIVQSTINGLGERAGNTSLEELVMALKVRRDHYKCNTHINTKLLFQTSKLVEKLTGIMVSPNKPVVGHNVFATEAGIHQAALLKKRTTYEIIRPEDVGQPGTTFVLGRHSGKHAIVYKLAQYGYDLLKKPQALETIYEEFKKLAVTKKAVSDRELESIAQRVIKRT